MRTLSGLARPFALCLTILALSGARAPALDYPTKPVHFIVCFAAGGPNDITARLFGQYLSDYLGQQFIIENRVGAGGNIGTQAYLAAPPDGYTIGFVGPNNAISTSLYDSLPFDFIRDSIPVAGTIQVTNVMEVSPSFPAKTVTEFIAYAKANPGKINFGSGGVGTSPHLSGELLKVLAGINIVHVAYRGTAPAVTDLLAGQVQVVFDNLPGSIGHIKAGNLRALGVTAAKRVAALPDVPAIGETVAGYDANVWYGIAVPKGTPAEIVNKLNTAVNAVLADPKLKERIHDLGGEPLPMSPDQFSKLVRSETDKWAKVIKEAHIPTVR
jgi:tripartite-type tricarboxylate transporter receptor subunit TctC